MANYRILEHTSDVGLEVRAASRVALFVAAGQAFCDVIFGLDSIRAVEASTLQVEAIDLPGLLVAFLSELLYRFEVEERLYRDFEVVSLSDTALQVTARGEAFDSSRHQVLEPVKAVTYHRLEVVEEQGQWLARVILDL